MKFVQLFPVARSYKLTVSETQSKRQSDSCKEELKQRNLDDHEFFNEWDFGHEKETKNKFIRKTYITVNF